MPRSVLEYRRLIISPGDVAEYDSGSIEEVERLATRGAKVMLYRSSRPIPPDILDTRQYDKLRDLSDQYRERGLLGQFGDINELREMVNKDLSLLLGKESATTPVHTASQVETVQRPDIRVRTRNMVASQPDGLVSLLGITVENHSPRKFFLSSVTLKLADGNGLWFKRDGLLHTPNAPQVIESGDSYSFHILPADLGDVDIQKIVCAEAHDKVGRTFNSDAEETRQSLDGVMKRHASS